MTDRRRRRSGSNTSQGESSPAVFVNIDPSSRQDTQPSGRNLLFVDANASPARAREATRVHVMREHHRARRLAMEDPASSSERIEGSSQSRRAAVQPIVTSEAEGSRPGDTLGDLNDPLGPGGSDLMGEYPVRPSPVVNSLVHHYTTSMGEPSHELLPLYRSDSASYRAILACAARHREVSEGSGDGIHSIQFITEALEIVQHRVREPQLRQSDGTVMAIALLASVEVRSSGLFREFGLMMQETWGEDYAARIHWRGLKAIIDERGGLSTLCEEPVLHAALMRLTHHGSIPLSTNSQLHPDGSDAVLNDGTTAAEAGEISRVSEEFVLFVQSITAHIMDEEGGEQGRPQQLLLLTLPQPAYGLLSIAQGWRPGPIGQRVAECTHLACLLYLAVTSLAFSASPQLTAHFSQWFGYVVRTGIPPLPQAGQDHLLFLLLKGPPDLEETESGLTAPEHHIYRVWLVSRLMSVAKKLKQASWTILTSRLLLFLRFPSDLLPQGAEEEARAELDMDELRREIYGDLYPYIRQ